MDQNNFPMDVGSSFSEGEDDVQAAEIQNSAADAQQQAPTEDISETTKNKVDNYNFEAAISELSSVINATSEMYQQLKRVKFNYLVLTCDLHSRIDFPSIMMEACRKEVSTNVPKPKDIDKLNF